jgi:MinD-like ATPase involved in chromosome partitioning or flagellar assembly
MNDKDRRRSSLTDELARIGLTPGAHNPPPAGNDATRSLAPPRAGQDAGALAWTRPTADSLTADNVLKPQRKRPASGWRKALYLASGGLVNPCPSAKELLRMELEARARTPIKGCHRVAVISLKGGVGKTTTTAALGAMFASLRGDRVIAVDANPDRGTLSEKVTRETQATVRNLLATADSIERYADVREFTSQAPNRLEVLASDSDPATSLAFSDADYRAVVEILERFYSLILTDCGTGLLHSALQGALALADSLIVVSSPSLDGARSASATLDWLEAHDHGHLARQSIAVINAVRRRDTDVDLDKLKDHFQARCRGVQVIPYDPHLATGSVIDLAELKPAARNAYLELAALVGEGFGVGRARH